MEYVEYIDKTEYVILYRMYGSGAIAEIPAAVAGRPVRMLADHLFANEPSVLYPQAQILRAVFNGTQYVEEPGYGPETAAQGTDGSEPALAGTALEIIRIPEGVEGIGNYAFYGCLQLREVSFPSTMKRIGNGMFNGCGQVCRLYFAQDLSDSDSLNPSVMKEVLDAVTNQIEAVITRDGIEQWRLTFPDYYEEGKENTPARIIDIVYHGTGYKYRNCFLYRQIQFEKYDAVFPFAAAQERASVCISIIRSRLRCGPEPKEEWKYRYIDYLRSEKELLIDTILTDTEFDPVCELGILDRAGYFTSDIIDAFIERASDRKRSDAVSFLMDVKRSHFAPRRSSKYEL